MSTHNSEEIEKEVVIEDTATSDEQTENTTEEVQLSVEEQLTLDLEKEKDKYLRLFAEFENYKRRTSKERIELFKTANQEVLQSILPVVDDFDRALVEINKSSDENLSQGVNLIYNKLKDVLVSKGLEEVEVRTGDLFNADIHEAITQIPAPDLKGKIVDLIEKGYKLGTKIIRFPKVVIGN